MKSPFPGMDPFIEVCDLWGDFHGHLVEKIYDAVSAALPKGYLARSWKRSYIVLAESEEKRGHHFEPDVKVTAPRKRQPTQTGGASSVSVVSSDVEPISMTAFIEEEFHEMFIDISELEPERRLVTSIEVLSPSNKRRDSKGWKKYQRKRKALLLGKASLVEIDLLRGGDRFPMVQAWPDCPYYVLVAREEQAPHCKVWPAYFDRPLPTVPVPLSKPDPDIPLDLQPLVAAVYERGRYDEDIDYSRPLRPPLTGAQAAWLESRLRAGSVEQPPAAPQKPRRKKKGPG